MAPTGQRDPAVYQSTLQCKRAADTPTFHNWHACWLHHALRGIQHSADHTAVPARDVQLARSAVDHRLGYKQTCSDDEFLVETVHRIEVSRFGVSNTYPNMS